MNSILKSSGLSHFAVPTNLNGFDLHLESTAPYTGLTIFSFKDYLESEDGEFRTALEVLECMAEAIRSKALEILNPTVWSASDGDRLVALALLSLYEKSSSSFQHLSVELDPMVAADAVCVVWYSHESTQRGPDAQ